MSDKINNSLITKTKAIFTVNDFDVSRESVYKSEDFMIGSNKWQIIVQTNLRLSGINESLFGIGLRLKSEDRLFVSFDSFIYDSNMKKSYHFLGKKFADFPLKWGITLLMTTREFMGQMSEIFPNKCLKIGVIITVKSKEVYECIQRSFGYRKTFNVKELNDLHIVCDYKEFFVSKIILSSHSEVFEKMFTNVMTEQNKNQMTIKDIDSEAFEEFLKFIYFGNSDKLEELKEDLLIIADKYQVLDLKEICENLIFLEICVLNAIKLLIFFNKYNCIKIEEKSIDFISRNLWEICAKTPTKWQELIVWHNQLLVRITERMAYLIRHGLIDDKITDDCVNSYTISYIN